MLHRAIAGDGRPGVGLVGAAKDRSGNRRDLGFGRSARPALGRRQSIPAHSGMDLRFARAEGVTEPGAVTAGPQASSEAGRCGAHRADRLLARSVSETCVDSEKCTQLPELRTGKRGRVFGEPRHRGRGRTRERNGGAERGSRRRFGSHRSRTRHPNSVSVRSATAYRARRRAGEPNPPPVVDRSRSRPPAGAGFTSSTSRCWAGSGSRATASGYPC